MASLLPTATLAAARNPLLLQPTASAGLTAADASSPTTTTPTTSKTTPASGSTGSIDNTEIASNFTTFLQLLTTQLKNQDPLSPLDTNQFTQQLVQFAQVEQQMKQNTQLQTLISIEQGAQSTVAMSFIGQTVVVDGSSAQLANNQATWTFNVSKPANATITVKDSTGQTAFTGTFAVNPGNQGFTWDGHGNDGKLWPPGTYTISASATDASGQQVAISSQVQGVVDSVDVSKTPPVLTINGQTYTLDKIKQVVRASSGGGGGGGGGGPTTAN